MIAPLDCASKTERQCQDNLTWGETDYQGIKIEAVSACNKDKQFHPKHSNFVGYVVTVAGQRIYHAGDPDFILEMEKLRVDIALLPVGGTYTMNAEEAASAANCIKPKLAIPMHYGGVVGSKSDAEKFKKL